MRIHRAFIAFALFVCVSVHAETVADLVASYGSLRLGEARSVTNLDIAAGHATYSLPSGSAAPLLAGEKQVGLFLSGRGKFRYETTNKDELSALRYNAKRADVKVDIAADKAVMATDFTTAVVLGNALPEITGASAPSVQEAFAQNRELFERGRITTSPAAFLLAFQQLDDPAARVVVGQIQGSQFPFLHKYDAAYDNDETLSVLLRPQQQRQSRFARMIHPVLLSQQAIGRGNRETPAPRLTLAEVDVNLVGNMNEEGKLTVIETIVPQKRPLRVLRFDLNKTIFLESESRDRHYNLRSVTDEQGRKLSFVHDDAAELIVGLAEPVPAGKPVKLTFEIDGNFLYREDKTNFWELGIEPWFPWVRLYEQAYRFHSVIKVEKPFVVFASGKSIRRGEEGNYNVIETRIDDPVDYIAILAGKYQYSEEVRKGVMIRVASFISKNEGAYRRIRAVAEAAIDYYPFFLGPFPFDEINVIEKDTDGTFAYGQAPAGIVFITSEAFKPLNRDLNDLVGGVNSRFAHEIAHMYFGSAVRRGTPEDQWLDEAFADYAAALFRKAGKDGAGEYERELIHWREQAKEAVQYASIPMANRLYNPDDPYGSFLTRYQLLYSKGPYLLAALHKELGDQLFLTFLKSYQKSFRWKRATTRDVIELLQFVTKKDYESFFEQYFYGTAMPEVKLK